MQLLVTGGTGHLGQVVVSGLEREGHGVRVLARRPRNDHHVEWVAGDLATGEGVEKAVVDIDVIVHAATNSPAAQRGRFSPRDFLRSPRDVDVNGTSALLAAAEQAGVGHFVHVSIVGLEHLKRVPYSRRKLQAEQLVRSSSVPSSIVRATSFYWLLERMFTNMARQRILALPADARMAPVDSDEFAEYIIELVSDRRPGDRQDFAGPETLSMIELMEQFLSARGVQRRISRTRLPKRVQAAITAGNTSPDARRGKTTWAEWLRRGPITNRG